MKLSLILSILLVLFVGCTSFPSYEKAPYYKAYAYSLKSFSDAYAVSGYSSQSEADKAVIWECQSKYNYRCLISHQGRREVWEESYRAYQGELLEELIDDYVKQCVTYGFTDQNAIATCVQREIHNEKILKSNKETISALKDIEEEVDDSWLDAILINEAIKRRKK